MERRADATALPLDTEKKLKMISGCMRHPTPETDTINFLSCCLLIFIRKWMHHHHLYHGVSAVGQLGTKDPSSLLIWRQFQLDSHSDFKQGWLMQQNMAPPWKFNEAYFHDLDGPLPPGDSNKCKRLRFSATDVLSPLVAPRRLQQSRVFAIAIWAAHRLISVGLSAMRVIATPARAAATHLDILVQGWACPLPVVVWRCVFVAAVAPLRRHSQLRLNPIPPTTTVTVCAGHEAQLANGAAGHVLLVLHLEANPLPVPFALPSGWVQELLWVSVLRHVTGQWVNGRKLRLFSTC